MRIMFDTNVLISLMLFPNERFNGMMEYVFREHKLVLSSLIVEELCEVVKEKFPKKAKAVDRLLSKMSYELVYAPKELKSGLFEIRDKTDYPVLYMAVIEDVDVFITGDKDFKDVKLEKPEILSPCEFIIKYM
jgi:putative PIN family toxin of toxin-antitoxin system